MRPRLDLHAILVGIITNVYFQPPTNVQLQYPCIIYERSDLDVTFSGNLPYNRTKRYTVTVIDRDPDSAYPDQVSALPMCTFDRSFTADDLNHDVFNIFF